MQRRAMQAGVHGPHLGLVQACGWHEDAGKGAASKRGPAKEGKEQAGCGIAPAHTLHSSRAVSALRGRCQMMKRRPRTPCISSTTAAIG